MIEIDLNLTEEQKEVLIKHGIDSFRLPKDCTFEDTIKSIIIACVDNLTSQKIYNRLRQLSKEQLKEALQDFSIKNNFNFTDETVKEIGPVL